MALEGTSCLLAPFLRSFPLLLFFSVFFGYFDGAYVALIPVVTAQLVGTPHLSNALGVVYFLHAIPYLLSPPVGGQRSHKQKHSHRHTHTQKPTHRLVLYVSHLT